MLKDIYSLGIHIGHDRCAALVKNGKLIASLAQERIDRIKHSDSSEIPYEVIDSLLNYCQINISMIDYIGITFSSVNAYELEQYYREELEAHYHIYAFELIPISHHLAHAESAFCTSDFTKALILVADGGGDNHGIMTESESLYIGCNNKVSLLEARYQVPPINTIYKKQNYIYPFMNKESLHNPISIGRKYEQITYLLGFKWGECGKTMGLASYGKSMLDFSKLKINSLDFDLQFGFLIQELYVKYLESGVNYFEFLDKEAINIAQTVQDLTETVLIQLIKYIIQKYNINDICLSGGTFLNCMLNHKLLEVIPNLRLHICPAAGDDGQAVGAAFHAYKKSGKLVNNSSKVLPYLGISYTNNVIKKDLDLFNLKYTYYDDSDLCRHLAQYIYCNKIVAIVRGRSEFGPRALCHRSILANPTWEGMKDHLNKEVKHREYFRPFAPVVIEEEAYKIFDLKQESPYMLLACRVKDEFISKIPSVTHIDKTARVQTVSKIQEPFIHDLLLQFEKLSGVPVLLNTSFNDNGEPIVESPSNAIQTFLNTNIDILVLENYIIEK
ncbi:carbamoyltransferase C-terminal domain-containing protein [Lachnospiraceae bacterium 48-21]|jgi:carbamoyltransferase|nr:hypothetical protein [Dorea sp.]